MEDTAARTHAHPGIGRYAAVWLALAALTALTWGLGHVHLGAWNVPVALLIASTKSMLVILFFMHLLEHRGVSWVALAVSVLFIVLLVALVLGDVALRFPATSPPGSLRAPLPPPASGATR